jgi:hypothetical protein
MVGTRALPKPRAEPPIDLLLVGLRGSPPQVLAHQLNTSVEEIKRESKRSDSGRRGRHARIVTLCLGAARSGL